MAKIAHGRASIGRGGSAFDDRVHGRQRESLARINAIADAIKAPFVRTSYAVCVLAAFIGTPVAADETALDSGIQQPEQTLALSESDLNSTEAPSDQSAANASPVDELEQLLQSEVQVPALAQEVTTVSGQVSTVGKSPAAVFVITQEMIKRSGATSIPEALRMAPGLQVARVNSSQWAVTSRGFNSDIVGIFSSNNKLLVLIDGRTVFTPFYNGTYWDVQDVVLEDVDRIEVIRGPGATIWGANAVNGVVNVITKRAADTQGGLVQAGGGTTERGFTNVRVGGQSGDDIHYRLYGKWFDRDASVHETFPENDDWRQGRGGFRMDWTPNDCDLLTLQGDMYGGVNGFFNNTPAITSPDDEHVHGGNVLGRWTRTFSDDNDVSLQLYYDRADRDNNVGFVDQELSTYDIEFRHHLPIGCSHNFIWGLGYRVVHDELRQLIFPPFNLIAFDPVERTYDTFSIFAQDEIELTSDHWLTIGSKLQHNDFSGWEVQPTIRLLYAPEESWATWAAVSRAVRTPSRIEEDGVIAAGVIPFLDFVPAFDSEELIAYELGYRSQPEEWFSWDVAMFFNQYENLASLALTPVTILPIVNANENRGEGYGIELSSQVEMTKNWRLSGYYSFLQLQIHPGEGAVDFLGANGSAIEGSSPHNQAYLMSSHDVYEDVTLDLMTRYVDELPWQGVDSYIELDIRLAWRPNPCTELAIVGQNLLDSQHAEYGNGYEIERGVYGMITRTW